MRVRACVRAAFGALRTCARRNTVCAQRHNRDLEQYRGKRYLLLGIHGGGDEIEFMGPLLSADGCA